jgi:hypothetical protein
MVLLKAAQAKDWDKVRALLDAGYCEVNERGLVRIFSPLLLLSSPPLCRVATPLSIWLAVRAMIPLPLFSWRGEQKSMTKIKSPVPPHPPLLSSSSL